MNFEKEKLLVIAPHPDDEIMGCFGLINKVKEKGGQAFVQILTLGGYPKIRGGRVKKEDWKKEFLSAIRFLKIDGYDIAFYEDKIRHLDTVPQAQLIELLEAKSKVSISKIKPTIVAIPTIFSTHQDHTYAYKISMAALRPHPQDTVHLPKLVVSYESPEYHFWSPYSELGKFYPDFYVQLSQKEVIKKIQALNLYKTQLLRNKRDDESILEIAKTRGREVGVEYAEAYHNHRLFV